MDIVPRLGEFDLVVTDPPYAITNAKGRSEWAMDSSTVPALIAAARSVAGGGAMVVFCTAGGEAAAKIVNEVGGALPLSRILGWRKKFTQSQAPGPWRWDLTVILVFGRGCVGRQNRSSVVVTDGALNRLHTGFNSGHPAEIPDKVARWATGAFPDARRVLDPFCGTGALLAPAVANGADAVGIERDPRWVKYARQRLAAVGRQQSIVQVSV